MTRQNVVQRRDHVQGRIVQVDPARRAAAVERLVAPGAGRYAAAAKRFLEFARHNTIDLTRMWSTLDERDQPLATVLAVPSPGRTAMFFATTPCGQADAALVGSLIEHAARCVAGPAVHLGQALLAPSDRAGYEAFIAGGFRQLAQLSYLERSLRRPVPPVAPWPRDVSLQPYRDAVREAFIAALDASYEQTMDCPGLLGLRRTPDILEGHRAAGRFTPALWTLLRIDDRPAGVLLLNPSAQGDRIELAYLGLAPWARGRGLGRALLRHGLQQMIGRPERRLALAVDDANLPAKRLYASEGFEGEAQRIAMVRPMRET